MPNFFIGGRVSGGPWDGAGWTAPTFQPNFNKI